MRRLLYFFSFLFLVTAANVSFAAPVANFSATPTSSCAPLIVQFTDLSTGSPTSWNWNLGNGSSSTLQNPSTTYTAAGTYTISLTVSNASGTDTKTITNYITVTATPTVSFIANDSTPSCGSKIVTFTNNSVANSSGTPAYYWDFGDGYTSTAQSPPAHAYTAAGTYTVQLVVTNSAGCITALAKTGYITILSKPVAGFTATNTNNCAPPVTTSFTNTSSGASTYQWDFGDGSNSTTASPSHAYAAAGSYTVRLIAISAGGCKDTVTQNSLVNIGSLTAGFTAPTTACTRNSVLFSNTTTPGGGGSTWYFGDGTTSNAISPSHTYTAAGTYTVKLVVNYSNCSDSVTHTITVSSGPTSSFTASPLVGCTTPLSVNFSNATSGATSYLWIFGDGTTSTATSPTHSYTAIGTYTVKLVSTSSNGCTDTLTQPNYINIQTPTATLSNNPFLGCAPATASFTPTITSLVSISSYAWNFGDGNMGTGGPNTTHSYTTAGSYTVTLTATTTTGCTFTATQNVIIGSHTTPAFSASPTTVCYKQTINFSNTTSGSPTSYTWLFGDGFTSGLPAPSHVYGNPGTFTVTLISSNNGCSDTLVKTNYIVINPPKASFTSVYSCTNRKAFTFTNTSIGGTNFAWDFGDGSTDTAKHPVHTYTSYGVYFVRLIATNSVSGCTDTFFSNATAFQFISDFTASDSVICKGAAVTMSGPPNPYYGFYSSAYFNYGDGTALNGNSTPHSYLNSGIYTVKLILVDLLGCIDSIVKPNYINVHAPTASFSNTSAVGCQQLSVTFIDNSTASGGRSITSRFWNFGDGTTLTTTATTVVHNYAAAGTFSVTLIVTETGGCTDDTVRANVITISRPMAAFISPDTNSCKNGLTSFINTSSGNAPLSYNWSFGDGGTSTTQNPTHTYLATGNYSIRLIVTDAGGCQDTLSGPNYIHVTTVQAAFTPSDTTAPCPPKVVTFTNNSVGGASTYNWTFGNGGTSSITNPSVIYTTPGTFVVKLITTNAAGCRDSATRSILINTGPSGTFSYTPVAGCAPVSIAFTSTSSGATSLTYDFGNGVTTTTTSSSVTYSFTQAGSYMPTLILSNSSGCSTYINGTSAINVVKASAGFYAAPTSGCVGTTVQFTDTSSTIGSSISTRNYNFGDGGTSTATNPTHTYTTAGIYSVRLIVTTAVGCVDTTFRTIVINALPSVNAGADVAICAGSSTTLSATGASTYSWSPSAGLSATTGASVSANPTSTTTYIVTGTSALGCIARDTVVVTVNPLPVVSVATPAAICSGSSTSLTATGATTYAWSPSAGLSATTGATVTASPTSTTTYIVTGTTNNCSTSTNVTVTVNPIPAVSATGGKTICAGTSDTLTASGATTYSWTPTTGLSTTTGNTVIASPTGTTTYTVTGTSGGCSATATTTVTITPIPVVSISGNNAICSGLSTNLTASGATTYSWSPATGLSATSGSVVTASPVATTTYTVTGTSGAGCTASTTVTVTVNALPPVNAGIDTAVCSGSSVVLTASGASSYSWSPATGLSGTTGTSVTASPTVTTNYIVTGTGANGCVKSDTVQVTVKALPTISAGSNVAVCPGGSATLTATGGTSYTWSPSAGLSATTGATVTSTPSATITYTVTGTGANGCINTAQIQVAVNATPTVTISGNNAICAGGNTSLTASGATSFSWSPSSTLSASTGTTVTASPATTTTYTVTGTSGVGCTATATFTLTVNPLPTLAVSGSRIICSGSSTSLTASGTSTYAWSPSAGLSATTGATVSANPTASTTYTVTGTSAAGCVNTTNVSITVNPLPSVSAGSNVAICPNGSTVLTASGASTYSWSPSTGLSATTGTSVTASPSSTTVYTVTGTDANGCFNTAAVTVTVNPTPGVSVTGTAAICTGGSTALTASGASTYSWSPATGLSATSGSSVTANPSATTTYTITGASGIGCTGTTTFTVSVNPLPTIAVSGTTVVCAGASTTLTASGASTYAWSPSTGLNTASGATVTATPTSTITYTVTGTSAAGCIGSTTISVTVNALPTIAASGVLGVCPGGSTTLTATGGVSYAWSPAATLSASTGATVTATPVTNTTYTITGTGSNGCTNTATITVAVNPKPAINISGNTSICVGTSTTLTASGASSYAWSPGTGLSSTTNTIVVVSISGTTTYKVIGTSSAGCMDSVNVTVTVHQRPVITVNADTTVCGNTPVQLNAGGAATYQWSPVTGLSCSSCANPVALPVATTTYVVRGTDASGCTDSARVKVTILPVPAIVASPDISICKATSTQLNATGALSYTWTPVTGLSCTTCANPVASPLGTTAYVVTGTGANGCSANDTVTVSLYLQPPVNAGPDQTICAGQRAQLQASGASSYVWAPATGLSCTICANPIATPAINTTFTVTGTDVHGCTDSDAVTISVIQRNEIKAGDSTAICEGESVKLYAEGGDSYLWYPASTLSCSLCATPTANPKATTFYYVVIKQGQCFSDTLGVPIVVHPLPKVNAGSDQSIILGNTTQLNATGTNIAYYSWSPGDYLSCLTCANPVVAPERDVTYTVTVRSAFGCEAQDDVAITVRCDGSQVWMPNTFTPNADGHNDFFYPHGKGITEITHIRIYDRWGELIWERKNLAVNDRNSGWDGTYKNELLKPDVYVWIMTAKCTNGEALELKGDISLIR